MVTENITEPVALNENLERVKVVSLPLTSSKTTSLTSIDKTVLDEDGSTTNTSTTTPPVTTTPTKTVSPSSVRHHGEWFKDDTGRTLLIRGVNVCGSSKLPTRPYAGSTHLYDETFWDHTNVSFVNRPFPLDEARHHFARLASWGFTCLRLLIPWEALEHKRGIYDEEFIDYLRELISIMADYDIHCFIDPHQDTWSRFSGGSGAPGWTLELAGLDMKSFKETGAAYVHNTNAVPGDPLPMVWPTNYTKLACCTMFTLFWAGDVFAPNHRFEGQSIQHILQSSFINSFKHLAERLQDLKNVIGFEVMNEPHPGYIGLSTLKEFDPIVNLIFGDAPTPLQSFALGDGIPQKVGVYIKSWPFPTKKSHSRVINASKTSAWLGNQTCIWKQHGVWGLKDDKPVLLTSDYFSKHPETGKKVDFYQDFYVPFVNKYAQAVQSVKSSLYCFVEPLANEKSPVFRKEDHHHNMIFAPHWYDLNCVFYKKFDGKVTHDVQALQNGGNVISATYFGQKGVKKNYSRQIKNIKQSGLDNMGRTPALFGEVGIPMDINDRHAFKTGDYTHQTRFMDAVIHSLEENLVNFTLWNYDANNDHEYGDHWNGENFSIYSSKQRPKPIQVSSENLATLDSLDGIDLNEGGRVLGAALRVYAGKIAGVPEKSSFRMDQLSYTLVFRPFDDNHIQELKELGFDTSNPSANQTEIYVPNYHYQDIELDIQASHGQCEHIPERQMLYHRFNKDDIGKNQVITITIKPAQSLDKKAKCRIM